MAGPKALKKLYYRRAVAPAKKGPLYTQSLAERQAVEGVPRRTSPATRPASPGPIHRRPYHSSGGSRA